MYLPYIKQTESVHFCIYTPMRKYYDKNAILQFLFFFICFIYFKKMKYVRKKKWKNAVSVLFVNHIFMKWNKNRLDLVSVSDIAQWIITHSWTTSVFIYLSSVLISQTRSRVTLNTLAIFYVNKFNCKTINCCTTTNDMVFFFLSHFMCSSSFFSSILISSFYPLANRMKFSWVVAALLCYANETTQKK